MREFSVRSIYNRIAGQNLERLAALSDGVFAVAMTLLVLDLRAPAHEAIHSEHDLLAALLALAPRLVTYLMSFLTLGIFWLGQLYAFGAALCVVNTYWSIAFIVLIQINYAVAPPWPSRR